MFSRVIALVDALEATAISAIEALQSRKVLATVSAIALFVKGHVEAAQACLAYVAVEGAADFKSR